MFKQWQPQLFRLKGRNKGGSLGVRGISSSRRSSPVEAGPSTDFGFSSEDELSLASSAIPSMAAALREKELAVAPPPLPPRYRFRDLILGDYAFNDDGER